MAGPVRTLPPRTARVRQVRHPGTGEVLDEALVLAFPAPHSFTGEDVAELHVHGGHAVVDGVLGALGTLDGLRVAEPGEFTRRAFEHGRLDLTQVEALADLVHAETAWQRRQALRHASGAVRVAVEGWRAALVRALAYVEALVDFGESDEVDQGSLEAARATAAQTRAAVRVHLADRRGEVVRRGVQVVLLGRPNAGKSSLLNRLVGRPAAIVSPTPGTTRDVVEAPLALGGFQLLVADTAGLRGADDGSDSAGDWPADEVEREGIARARARAVVADLCLAVVDGRTVHHGRPPVRLSALTPETLVALTHADLVPRADHAALAEHGQRIDETPAATRTHRLMGGRVWAVRRAWGVARAVWVSNTTGDGMDALTAALQSELEQRYVQSPWMTIGKLGH
jgi:tRNA modification GTPase